jgi:hypothetical protein
MSEAKIDALPKLEFAIDQYCESSDVRTFDVDEHRVAGVTVTDLSNASKNAMIPMARVLISTRAVHPGRLHVSLADLAPFLRGSPPAVPPDTYSGDLLDAGTAVARIVVTLTHVDCGSDP